MKTSVLTITFTGLMLLSSGVSAACEYVKGETQFADYAKCRYGEDAILVVDLPEGSSWDNCIYHLQAFRPEELLAVSKTRNGKETHSINDRGQIGNPCYLTKSKCDAALKALKASGGY